MSIRPDRPERADIQKIILGTVAVAGILAVGLLAPNVLGELQRMRRRARPRQNDVIRTARDRLLQKGLLAWDGNFLRLTKKGEEKLQNLRLRDYQSPKPRRWDRKWRVLVFDIPEKKRRLRDKIREVLIIANFRRLQDSVWVYPYPCDELVVMLKADLRIGKEILHMTVDTIEYDRPLREHFKLQ